MNRNKSGFVYHLIISMFAVLFAVFWTATAFSMTPFMGIFGLFFIVMVGFNLFRGIEEYQHQNERYERMNKPESSINTYEYNSTDEKTRPFCPFCGAKIKSDYEFCPKCGNRVK